MIDQSDYIGVYDYRNFCDAEFTPCCYKDLLPKKCIIYCPADCIREFFQFCEENPDNRYIVVSAASDFGLHYQSEYPVNLDIEKGIARLELSEFKAELDKYLYLHVEPACILDKCDPSHKYSLRCWFYTQSTFDRIPPNVVKWFCTNVNVDNHDNLIECLPLGLLYKNHYKYNENKTILFYVNFGDSTLDRPIFKKFFSKKPWATLRDKLDLQQYIDDLSLSAFVLNPPGNGLDGYRIYETLYSNSIPVVKKSQWSSYFQKLPILIVDDFTTINDTLLLEVVQACQSRKFNKDLIKLSYWKQLIKDSINLL